MRVAQPADTLLYDMTGIDTELLIFYHYESDGTLLVQMFI